MILTTCFDILMSHATVRFLRHLFQTSLDHTCIMPVIQNTKEVTHRRGGNVNTVPCWSFFERLKPETSVSKSSRCLLIELLYPH